MPKSLDNLTQSILAFILPVTAFVIPLLFVPMTLDFFTPHKRFALVVLASIALLAWIGRAVLRKTVHFTLTPATVPLIIMGAIFIISSLMQSPNVLQAFTGETSIILSLVIILVTTTSTLKKPEVAAKAFQALLVSMSLVSLFAILQFIQVGKLTGIDWLQSPLFNPAGGPLNYLSASLPLLAAVIAFIAKTKKANVFYLVSGMLLLVASGMSGVLIYTNGLQFMPFTAGWVIAMGALQNPMAALLGTGPNTYQSVYNILKPAFVNTDALWNISFVNSANFYLHLLTTTGLISFLAYIFATVKTTLAGFSKSENNAQLAAYATLLAVTLVVQLILPPNIIMLTVTFLAMIFVGLELKAVPKAAAHSREVPSYLNRLLAVKAAPAEYEVENTSEKYDLLFWFAGLLVVILVGYNSYLTGMAYASEYVFGASLRAAAANDGTGTYNLQARAIGLKPYEPQYRIAYAQTNMALANSLASQENVSDDVQSDILQLIQQAIREAKVAIELDPANSIAWQNLAVIYQQLIGLAEGADQWTLEAYQQAIALDPSNPQLRLDLGGIFYGAKNYEQAVNFYTQAVQLKQDWPNAYYNLAVAYRDAKQPALALQAMRVVVELLDPASPDYQQAQDELEELKEAAAQAEAEQAEQQQSQLPAANDDDSEETERLTAPSPRPSPALEEEIELPADAAPEVSPAP